MHDNGQSQLIESLCNGNAYDHPIDEPQVLQTHLSWVILTGQYAYKIKKPVDLGFADFSSLEKRKCYCERELKLNRRQAPQLYLDVVPITGTLTAPTVADAGVPIEFAVKMQQFRQEQLLTNQLQKGRIRAQQIDRLADDIASFHHRVAVAGEHSPYSSRERVEKRVWENFEVLGDVLDEASMTTQLNSLQRWTEQEIDRHRGSFGVRKDQGFIRECHGDLHAGNMVVIDGVITPFDCIEFNDHMRWIDTISEIAFVSMDLQHRGHPEFAYRLLNRYLEKTGDYDGLPLLKFYMVYRALVRAKVAGIRIAQSEHDVDWASTADEVGAYLDTAGACSRSSRCELWITYGFSGSGKTTGSQRAVEQLGAIRLRSDVERKRMFGKDFESGEESLRSGELYSPESIQHVYDTLQQLAKRILQAGFTVVVDATFLKRPHREQFQRLAEELNRPFRIISFDANEETLYKRIEQRREAKNRLSDADHQVLKQQLATYDELAEDERRYVVSLEQLLA